MAKIPERIGKYTISEVLGQGAMGVVYRGFDPHIQRKVAIKTIHKSLLGDPAANAETDSIAARFRNEAQAVGRIMHPGVVAIYEFGEDENTAYIAMEFVEGTNLDRLLAGTPRLPEVQILQIMDQLLDALAAAHDQGVWHRDIKPANLLVTAAGQVKLTDFGIARIAGLGLTQVSAAIGTPGYMAPEQFLGEGIDQRSDIFACGALLYRLLTGKAAFSGSTEAVMYKVMNEHPAPPSKAVEDGARWTAYDSVVARAIAKRSADRFPDARAMRTALLAAARGVGASSSDNEATIVVTPSGPAPAPAADWQYTMAAALPPPKAPSSQAAQGSSATALAHWDAQTLSRIERALASHVGPMAKLMVREAARNCGDVASLASAVSHHIADLARRAQFMSVATGGSQARPTGAGTALGTPPPATAGSSLRGTVPPTLTDAFLAKATQALTRHLGPIAKVVVKRKADQAGGNVEALVQGLLAEVPEKDRDTLLRALRTD